MAAFKEKNVPLLKSMSLSSLSSYKLNLSCNTWIVKKKKKNQFSNNQNQKAKHVISNNELVLSHMYRPAGKQKSYA